MENIDLTEPTFIPFMGDNEVPANTQPHQMAPWIDNYDRVPLLLAISLYNAAAEEIYPFKLIPGSNKVRAAAWLHENGRVLVIGCRGTDVGRKYGIEDLGDDAIIATGPYCELTLVALGSALMEVYGPGMEEIIFAGNFIVVISFLLQKSLYHRSAS